MTHDDKAFLHHRGAASNAQGVRAGMSDGVPSRLDRLADSATRLSSRLAWVIDRVCVVLAILLVLDVWLGVLVRYVLPLPITFMEEAARYLMIWLALLAVSSGISRREHIGVQLAFGALPLGARRALLALIDMLGIVFFVTLLVYGTGMVERGSRTFTMIYGMSKALPFLAVPVSAALAAVQLALVAVRDQRRIVSEPQAVFP
ncbi:MAG: TRAP transporter small permease subunit [Burkholderiales bacterium]|nr:MAG: TRAP transporter small permease subunit [Burkholderiales bacterium]